VEEESLGKFYDGRLMKRLAVYIWPYRTAVFISVGFLIVNSVLQILGPLLTKIAVDRYLAPPARFVPSFLDPWLPAENIAGLAFLSVLYLAAMLLGLIMSFGQTYLMNRTAQHAMFDLRRDLIAHLQRIDLSYYDRTPVGRILTRVTTDVDALNEMFASGVVAMLGDVVVISFLLVTMLKLSPGMTLLLLAAMPFVFGVTVIFRRQVRGSNRRIRSAVARINAHLQEHISGIAVVQLFNREARSAEEFDKVNAEHRDAYKDAIFAYGWFYPVVELLAAAGLASLLIYGGWRIREGALTLGVLVAFFQYGLRFYRPIQDMSEKYSIMQTAMAAAERVFQLLDQVPSIAAPAVSGNGRRAAASGGAVIEFDRVWFEYKHGEPVLRDMSFRIQPGETIAVVGHTGAGKTTLINLLLRFYDVTSGSIRVDGIDVRDMDPTVFRRRFGIVLQDPFLFTGTLGENIRLGTDGIPEDDLRLAIQRVNLGPFVAGLEKGLDHPVRERGAGLSTGQKQLVSFARALAHAPDFLILDEATSSVDTETEMKIREALERLIEGRTSIIIAHRLSTIQRADRILVLHRGELRESGSHQELLAHRGIYWKLYQLQYKDQESS
jgi:ATP-binding cassette subfamily B protein